ncbi:(2Fe-2S)-binding protein [Bradyrhizobium sp. HKCCYLRH1065]|uniref:(2Fe-2S)-binding protein n=1 Tax=unclassified Bradyrhizobium TaxID=2631580 RepID=UPI003EBC6362
MIVCSCNVISDHDIRNAVKSADELPRNPKQVYGCLGCSAECGRCARTIKTIIDEALGPCARACQAGCQHGLHHGTTPVKAIDDDLQSRFALAAC